LRNWVEHYLENGWSYNLRNDTLVDNPDFSDLNGITKQIEKETLNFLNDIEDFLSKH
jgi:hypothetical protein